MVFGEIIGEIGFAWGQKHDEMTLFDAIAHPVGPHVDGA
jgi:hypothetical protein